MTELAATASGMSAGQLAVMSRGALSTLHRNATRVGSKNPCVLKAAGTLEVIGQQPCGDFSGTVQQINAWRPDESAIYGSGGPANLRYSPTGTDTVLGAGRLLADGGSTTTFTAEQTPGTYRSTWEYHCAIRSMRATIGSVITGVDWTAATFKLTKAGLVASCAFDGDTLAHVTVAGTGGATGWYRVASVSGTDDVFLTQDRYDAVAGQTPGAGSALLNPSDVSAGISVQFHNSTQSVSITAGAWDEPRQTFYSTGSFSAAVGTNDTLQIISGNGTIGSPGTYFKVDSKVSNDAVLLRDAGVTASQQFPTAAASFTFVGLHVDEVAAFTGYTRTAGDRFVVLSAATGVIVGSYAIASKTSNDVIVLSADARLTVNGTTLVGYIAKADIVAVYWKRTAFEDKACTWTTDGTAITLGSALSFTPKQGDFYYIYILKDNGGGAVWDPQPENNPEEAPTTSQLSSVFCSWPYGHLGKNSKSSNHSQSGFGNLIAAVDGTLMNHAWFGDVLTAPRCFLSGDKMEIDVGPIDTTYNGTPFLIETLLIPGFDPPRHYHATPDFKNSERLLDSAVAFQSPPFTLDGFRPTHFKITGTCGSVQTTKADESGDNISHEWAIQYGQGPASAGTPGFGASEGDPRIVLAERRITKTILLCARVSRGSWSPSTAAIDKVGAFIRYSTANALDGDCFIVESGSGWKQGAYLIDAAATNAQTTPQKKRKIILIAGQPGMGSVAVNDLTGYVPDRTDWHNNPVRWTFLMTGVHPSQRGIMGTHGYYPGEPFNCDTGNGGVLFGFFGAQFNGATAANTKLPTGPRFRCSSYRYTFSQGGSN